MTNDKTSKNETSNATPRATAKPTSRSWHLYILIPGVSTLTVIAMFYFGMHATQEQAPATQQQALQAQASDVVVEFDERITHATTTSDYAQVQASINGVEYTLDLADTAALRTQGLSGQETLEADRGMLFVFPSTGVVGIWMKDMNIPIDILWLNENKQVVHIERSVSPDTYPETFQPLVNTRYVIELPAGSIGE